MKLNKQQQLLVGLAIVIAAFLFAHFVVLKPDRRSIEQLNEKITQHKQNINIARNIKQSATVLEEEMAHLTAQLERLKKILPVDINKSKFMADVKRYANENGVEIISITNNKPTVTDVIIEHPFTYTAQGNYNDFGKFFAQLSNYPRIVNVKGVYLAREEDDAVYTTRASYIVSVFTYNEPTPEELAEQIAAKKAERSGRNKPGGRGRK